MTKIGSGWTRIIMRNGPRQKKTSLKLKKTQPFQLLMKTEKNYLNKSGILSFILLITIISFNYT